MSCPPQAILVGPLNKTPPRSSTTTVARPSGLIATILLAKTRVTQRFPSASNAQPSVSPTADTAAGRPGTGCVAGRTRRRAGHQVEVLQNTQAEVGDQKMAVAVERDPIRLAARLPHTPNGVLTMTSATAEALSEANT